MIWVESREHSVFNFKDKLEVRVQFLLEPHIAAKCVQFVHHQVAVTVESFLLGLTLIRGFLSLVKFLEFEHLVDDVNFVRLFETSVLENCQLCTGVAYLRLGYVFVDKSCLVRQPLQGIVGQARVALSVDIAVAHKNMVDYVYLVAAVELLGPLVFAVQNAHQICVAVEGVAVHDGEFVHLRGDRLRQGIFRQPFERLVVLSRDRLEQRVVLPLECRKKLLFAQSQLHLCLPVGVLI